MLAPKKISALTNADIVALKGYEEILIEMFDSVDLQPPTFIIIKNTYGAAPWIYFDDVGQYELRHEKGFPQHRTTAQLMGITGNNIIRAHYANSVDPNGQVDISVMDINGSFIGGGLSVSDHVGTFLHVKIYPLPD